MSNPPKAKGTGFETEVTRALGYPNLRRTSPGINWDIEEAGPDPIEVLATRPDRGRTLVTLPLDQFAALYDAYAAAHDVRPGLRIECKRYKAFALHTIYESKFSYRTSRRTTDQAESG